jgi:hypothetical protein
VLESEALPLRQAFKFALFVEAKYLILIDKANQEVGRLFWQIWKEGRQQGKKVQTEFGTSQPPYANSEKKQ